MARTTPKNYPRPNCRESDRWSRRPGDWIPRGRRIVFTGGRIDTAMHDTNPKPIPLTHDALFGRYSPAKMERFNVWSKRNPGVYKLFVRYATEYRKAGYDRCSASLIGNRIRWECAVRTTGSDFKIPNDYLPMMARRLALQDGTFAAFFSFHGLTGEGTPEGAEADAFAE